MNRFTLWFGFRASVNRRTYLVNGLLLITIKYGVDAVLALLATGDRFLDPISYLHPLVGYRYEALMGAELSAQTDATWWMLATMAWSLPFIWIGVSMSARRALDAGMSVWLSLLFFVPVVNLLLIVMLCIQDSAPPRVISRRERVEQEVEHLVLSALKAVGLTGLFGTAMGALIVLGLDNYGSSVFIGTPFVMGVLGSYLVHRPTYRGWRIGVSVALLSVGICAGLMIVFALEGALCLIMAGPIAAALAALGALAGGAMVRTSGRLDGSTGAMIFALPMMSVLGIDQPPVLVTNPVVTTIEIEASPERVWPNVVGFSELPPPSDWLLKTGVAIPIRARIEGTGVGAIRYCEFTTGPFVEPITVWDYPNRLAFDVTQSPPSMMEWSPYQVVHAPHLMGNMLSRRGQFKLIRLGPNRTRLEGTTWYTLDMEPGAYWTLWSDFLVHRIHQRVLKHIKHLSETQGLKASVR